MALTALQQEICRVLSTRLRRSGESYIAGGVALNYMTEGRRLSRDLDLFHDTSEALREGFVADVGALGAEGYAIEIVSDATGHKEAIVSRGGEKTIVQWTRDSAFRFFPLVEHDLLGLILHPFDLATNKVLALVGRLEPRDWVDLLECHRVIQPVGYLMWAACGKDPGYSPTSILNHARRNRYSQEEIEELAFDGTPPSAAALGREWHTALEDAETIVEVLPPEHLGTCILEKDGGFCRRGGEELEAAMRNDSLRFHPGRIKGVYPLFSR
jgi:hypothetical protein